MIIELLIYRQQILKQNDTMQTLLEDLKKLKNDYESIEVMLMLIDDTYIKYEDIEEPLNDIP